MEYDLNSESKVNERKFEHPTRAKDTAHYTWKNQFIGSWKRIAQSVTRKICDIDEHWVVQDAHLLAMEMIKTHQSLTTKSQTDLDED